MCSDHKVTGFFFKDKHDPDPEVCLECESRAKLGSNLWYIIPTLVLIATLAGIFYVEVYVGFSNAGEM